MQKTQTNKEHYIMKFKHLLIIFLIINIVCFAVTGIDKRLSQKETTTYRVAETSLITYSSFGGAIGTLTGFYVFHHKISDKKQYLRRNLYILLLENLILYLLIYKVFKKRNN